ncbi:hypothetical protein [Ferrimonas marina]|uniref:Uncharacterized protein n=1 Tax=Ferrimonas marina TaxID=299255 RepID=A0A1M5RHP1_9GAMM|nr:hypothetical protein [Ferrimonas marina]SHH25718.1 hypothetical protein SAMN02745129_1625 [Ferrimonas marina]
MKKCILALTTAALLSAPALAAPDVNMSIKSGNFQFGVNAVTHLGKVKNGVQKSENTPYRLFDCEAYFTKSFRVKNSGSQWRSYRLDIIDQFPSFALAAEYLPHMNNGNSTGQKIIYSNNNGHINYGTLQNVIVDALDAAYDAADEDFPTSTEGYFGSEQPADGIKLNLRCKWENFLEQDYSSNKKKTWSVSIFDIKGTPIDYRQPMEE